MGMSDLIPESSDESETERDGFLSTRTELHAVGIGLYDGMRTWRHRPDSLPENEDVQAEPHYYKGAYVVGTVLQTTIAIIALLLIVL